MASRLPRGWRWRCRSREPVSCQCAPNERAGFELEKVSPRKLGERLGAGTRSRRFSRSACKKGGTRVGRECARVRHSRIHSRWL